MNGYGQKKIFEDTYKKLMKELHYTDEKMHKEFPDLCRKMEDEYVENLNKEHILFLKKIDAGII